MKRTTTSNKTPVFPIHFNPVKYRNSNEHACGEHMVPGEKCADDPALVTCQGCIGKLVELGLRDLAVA